MHQGLPGGYNSMHSLAANKLGESEIRIHHLERYKLELFLLIVFAGQICLFVPGNFSVPPSAQGTSLAEDSDHWLYWS